MRRALLALALVAAGIATASASNANPAQVSPDALLQPTAELNAAHPSAEMHKTVAPVVRASAQGQPPGTQPGKESAWDSLGGMLATLALIGVIAVRRSRARNL